MGGSSTINYMIYIRGNPNDYNEWAKKGNYGWSYEEVLPYFLKSENNKDREVNLTKLILTSFLQPKLDGKFIIHNNYDRYYKRIYHRKLNKSHFQKSSHIFQFHYSIIKQNSSIT